MRFVEASVESAFVLLRDIGEGCTCECKCAVSLVRGTIGGDSSGWVPNRVHQHSIGSILHHFTGRNQRVQLKKQKEPAFTIVRHAVFQLVNIYIYINT